jgi:hypothetical protein
MPEPTMQNAPAQFAPHPEKPGCTCPQGLKLQCPIHGMHGDDSRDMSWSIPQAPAVSYPDDQPRNYMTSEGAMVPGIAAQRNRELISSLA